MITKEQYLADPCGSSSLPYWKAKDITIPKGMKIIHDGEYFESEYQQYDDDMYFRLFHDLQNTSKPQIPAGFYLSSIPIKEYAEHINACYNGISVSESRLISHTAAPVYNAKLWIAAKENLSGAVAATGIADFDSETGEGILEWIQVSEQFRRRGLGEYIVSELLWRMSDFAEFATVSGQCNNPTSPELLYRKCGFTGSDIWHILRKIETKI